MERSMYIVHTTEVLSVVYECKCKCKCKANSENSCCYHYILILISLTSLLKPGFVLALETGTGPAFSRSWVFSEDFIKIK